MNTNQNAAAAALTTTEIQHSLYFSLNAETLVGRSSLVANVARLQAGMVALVSSNGFQMGGVLEVAEDTTVALVQTDGTRYDVYSPMYNNLTSAVFEWIRFTSPKAS